MLIRGGRLATEFFPSPCLIVVPRPYFSSLLLTAVGVAPDSSGYFRSIGSIGVRMWLLRSGSRVLCCLGSAAV
jgi:hypothetical protein